MVKLPTKHGLDRKFKPWRRGKSEKANKRGSLKQQLRGFDRLLKKIPPEDKDRRQELEEKIKTLQLEIEGRQKVLKDKKNAEKAHGQRFLDRQRLTRQEKQLRKQYEKKGRKDKGFEELLLKVAVDQVYVAHHPYDVKYMPLFRKGERVVETSRQLYRRAVTRRRILRELQSDVNKVAWISIDQYNRLPKDWTIQDEERVFGGSISRQSAKGKTSGLKVKEDSRFAVAKEHNALLQAADDVDAKLDAEEKESSDSDSNDCDPKDTKISINGQGRGHAHVSKLDYREKSHVAKGKMESGSESDSSSDSDDDEEDVDPLQRILPKSAKETSAPNAMENGDDDDDSSTSSSSDDEDEEVQRKITSNSSRGNIKSHGKADNGIEDSSSDDSSSDDDDRKMKSGGPEASFSTLSPPKIEEAEEEEEFDDFLMDADDGEEGNQGNVFSMTLKQVPAMGEARGDKSRGWETQQQRPGQFKRRRQRR